MDIEILCLGVLLEVNASEEEVIRRMKENFCHYVNAPLDDTPSALMALEKKG